MAFRKGDTVKQVVPVITGEVVSFSVDQESGQVQYLVQWQNADGEVVQRYFTDSEIEAA